MESKFLEMKKKAEIAVANNLSMEERETLNERMKMLKYEYDLLGKQKSGDYR